MLKVNHLWMMTEGLKLSMDESLGVKSRTIRVHMVRVICMSTAQDDTRNGVPNSSTVLNP